MRRGLVVALGIFLAIGGWVLWQKDKTWSNEVSTLEIRFSAEHVLQAHQKELLKSEAHTFLETTLTYLPYLWMDVKYAKDAQTTEDGIVLWGLEDGEMVLDAHTWEKTHGYEDCLRAKADAMDFMILNTIAFQGGALSHEQLAQSSSLDSSALEHALKKCEKKKLLLEQGGVLRLHLNRPHFANYPSTHLQEELVTASSKSGCRAEKRYSTQQIKTLAEHIFGHDFTIRQTREVYLPVYTISVQNPDGSVLKTQWNALNGEKIRA